MAGPVKIPAGKTARKARLQASRKKVVNESKFGRQELLNANMARASARRKTTRTVNMGGIDVTAVDMVRGENLKEGIMGMAQKANCSPEAWEKLQNMNPEKLDALYQNNKFVFDVYFNYGNVGVEEDGAMNYVDKNSDIDFLIETYERSFGVVLRYGPHRQADQRVRCRPRNGS